MKLQYFAFILFLNVTVFAQPGKLGIDYHVHIQSPEISREMEKLCGTLLQCPEGKVKSSNAKHVLESIDSTKFNRAIIMSMAYMASMPELELDTNTQKSLTRSENQFIADQVATSENLHGFFSLNPLTGYAQEEATYWLKQNSLPGLKLHLANSDFDYFNPEHVKKLQDIFRIVDNPDMTILIHMRNRNPDYGAKDVEVFISDILQHAPQSTFIIAHAAGWGGYDEATDNALSTLIAAMKSGRIDSSRIYLDLAAVILPPTLKFTKEMLANQKADFKMRFAKTNIANWVFGSDWSPHGDLSEADDYLDVLIEAGISKEIMERIISNRLPFVK